MSTRCLLLLVLALAVTSCGDPLADLNYRGPVVVKGTVMVGPAVICSADPLYDCKGPWLFVGVIDRPQELPGATLIGSAAIPDVDLGEGRQASYEIAGVPAGTYYIAAMLTKSAVIPEPPYPKEGDIAVAPQPLEIIPGVVTVHDIQLDIRWK